MKFLNSLARIRKRISIAWQWIAGTDWQPGENGKCGSEAIAAYNAMLLAVIGGLLALLHDRNPTPDAHNFGDKWILALYCAISLIPLLLLFLMKRERLRNSPPQHAYDPGTIMMANFSLALGTVVVMLVTLAGIFEFLPGQEATTKLKVISSKIHKFENDTPELKISKGDSGVVLDLELLGRYPDTVHLFFRLSKAIKHSWQISAVVSEIGTGGIDMPPNQQTAIKHAYWHDLKPNVSNHIKLYLHNFNDGVSPDALLALLKDDPDSIISADAYIE